MYARARALSALFVYMRLLGDALPYTFRMTRACEVEGCGAPHFGRGYCNRHYWQFVRTPKKEVRMASCAWCGERKPIGQMRHPSSSRGKTPSTCHACREANPDFGWCDFHGKSHPKGEFPITPNRPIGIANDCKAAVVAKASRKRGHEPLRCLSCGELKESWNFRGGRSKCPNCRDCEALHPDEHWCKDCAAWLPKANFTQTGKEGKYLTVRCHPCRTAHSHGVTVQDVLARQGVDSPMCGACGSIDFLKIDHDHNCCPTARGCRSCVRGYLCHACNTAEGLLRTADRARKLAEYIERHESLR